MGIEYFVKEMKDNFMKGVEEFSQHPIKYSAKAAGEFVGDHWDLVGAVAVGYAITDFGGSQLGDLKEIVFRTGSIMAVLGPVTESVIYSNKFNSTERFTRNIAAGATSLLYFGGNGGIPNAGSLLMGGVTLILDKAFKQDKKYRQTSKQKTEVLEKQIL